MYAPSVFRTCSCLANGELCFIEPSFRRLSSVVSICPLQMTPGRFLKLVPACRFSNQRFEFLLDNLGDGRNLWLAIFAKSERQNGHRQSASCLAPPPTPQPAGARPARLPAHAQSSGSPMVDFRSPTVRRSIVCRTSSQEGLAAINCLTSSSVFPSIRIRASSDALTCS
jgi:hypothetical protein